MASASHTGNCLCAVCFVCHSFILSDLLSVSIETLGSSDPKLQQVSQHLWSLVNHWLKHELQQDTILDKWTQAHDAIAGVVPEASARDDWRHATSGDLGEEGSLDGGDTGDTSGCDSRDEGLTVVTSSSSGSSSTRGSTGVKGKGRAVAKRRKQVKSGDGKRVIPTGEDFDRQFVEVKETWEKALCTPQLEEYRLMMEGKFRGRVFEHLMQEEVDKVRGAVRNWFCMQAEDAGI